MKLEDAERMAAEMSEIAPEGVHYEAAHTNEGQLVPDDEPDFGGWFVRRVGRPAPLLRSAEQPRP